jgi:hypothetical protein
MCGMWGECTRRAGEGGLVEEGEGVQDGLGVGEGRDGRDDGVRALDPQRREERLLPLESEQYVAHVLGRHIHADILHIA